MILVGIFIALFGLVSGIIALLPTGDPPAFMTSVSPLVEQAFAAGHGLGAWVPWGVCVSVAGVIFTLWLALIAVSGVRWLVGWIPTMGGA